MKKLQMKKFDWKKMIGKAYVASAGVAIALTPSIASAEAPSSYVNGIADGLFGEILKVAPKIALVVVAWAVLMYIMAGDEHKKSKYKSTGMVTIVIYLVLLVLKPLLEWFGGLV